MNDELNQQNDQGKNYLGVGLSPEPVTKSVPEPVIDGPKYMNLGAPRDRDEEDLAHHQNNMNSLVGDNSKPDLATLGFTPKSKTEIIVPPKKTGSISRFFARYFNMYFRGPHFKLVKGSGIATHTISSKIKWSVIVIFLAVSVGSFLTQSVLFIKDYFLNHNGGIVAGLDSSQQNNLATNATGSNSASTSTNFANEFRGSDDGTNANGSSTGQKIGKAPQYRLNDAGNFPTLSSKSFLVADLKTGEIIKESQDTKAYPLASVSKLMTAVVTTEKIDSKSLAIVSKSSYNTFGTEGELLLGESIRVSDLMYPLLMESSNDAAEVLADSYGHDKFMSEMNKKALALGMHDTYYNDPSGLDPKNVSTVEDQFKLAKYIYDNIPVVFDLTRVRQFEILNHRWYSKNKMLNMDSFLGGKNGFIDEAKQTTTCLFDIQLAKGGKKKIVIVLLRTSDREGDVVKIINFLKKNGYYEEVL